MTQLLHLLLAVLPILTGPEADETPRFDDFFLDKALRIDIHHLGTFDDERACIHVLKEEKIYSGSKKKLVDDRDLGNYRYTLRDAASGRTIFMKGYCTLFNEWRTIQEARLGAWRAMEHTLMAPFPRAPVILTVMKRGRKEGWKTILEQKLSLDERFIVKDNPFEGARAKAIMLNGEPSDKVDILIMGDGYKEKELSRFDKDAKRIFKLTFQEEPFKKYRNRFNVWTVRTPSIDSGVDEPRRGLFRNTALGVSFNTFDLARYSLSAEIHNLYDAAAAAPHDVIVLIFNSPRMGGGGIYNLYVVCSARTSSLSQVMIHELGHALAGLADEYVGGVTYVEFHAEGTEPWEANVTAMLDPRNVKWKKFIEKGTPLPTPAHTKFSSKVGCFEGAGYQRKGLFRPCLDCVMRSLRTSVFCPVCMEAVEKEILFQTE